MASIHGFEEFEEELRGLARRFEQAAEKRANVSDELVRARDPSGKFTTFREAIAIGIGQALRKDAIPQAEPEARQYLPNSADRGRSPDPQIGQESAGWQGDRYTHYFYSTNDLVKHHEFGTGQHSARGTVEGTGTAGPGYYIRPTDADALVFNWEKKGGMKVAFQYVVHPGVKGKHFMQRALRGSTDTMKREIASQIDNLEFGDL